MTCVNIRKQMLRNKCFKNIAVSVAVPCALAFLRGMACRTGLRMGLCMEIVFGRFAPESVKEKEGNK